MEIVHMGGPGERSTGLLDPSDEHPGFIPSDIGGRGGHMKNKHVVERGRDKKDRQPPLSSNRQLHCLLLFFYLLVDWLSSGLWLDVMVLFTRH